MNDHDYILRASAAAMSAASLARTATAEPPPVDPSELARTISTLERRALAGLQSDPHDPLFLFAEWDPFDARRGRFYAAVAAKLRALGLHVDEQTKDIGTRPVPFRLFVTFASLNAAAATERARRASIVDHCRALWTERFAGDATATVSDIAIGEETVLAFTAPPYQGDDATWLGDPRRARLPLEWRTDASWMEREPAEIAGLALVALRIPVWSFDAVNKLWADASGGDVVRWNGRYDTANDVHLHGPSILFRVGDTDGPTLMVEDVYALTTEQLVERALDQMGATPAPPPPPAETPATKPEEKPRAPRGARATGQTTTAQR